MSARIILMAMLLAGCQPVIEFKEDDSISDPQFSFVAELNGIPVSAQAGINNNYLRTEVAQDSRAVYETMSALSPFNCVDCPNSWEFILRDHAALEPQAPMLPDSTFQRKAYPFYRTFGNNLFRIQLQNQSLPGLGNQLLWSNWEIWDSTGLLMHQSFEPSPELLMPTGNYRVRLTSFFSNGCNNSFEKVIQAVPVNANCTADFHYSLLNNNSIIQLHANSISLQPPVTIHWLVNGNTYVGNNINLYADSLGGGGVHTVRMIAFNNSCTTEVVKQVTHQPTSFCTVNFRVNSSAFIDPVQTGTLRVNYRRADGKLFSSAFGDQPVGAQFDINDVSNYINNLQGKPVKKISGSLSCILYSADGTEQIQLTNGRLVLGFPYQR